MKYKEQLSEKVISYLKERDIPVKLNELSKHLGIISESPDYLILKDALNELVQNNIINKSSRRRYSIVTNTSGLIRGVIRIEYSKGIVETTDPDFPTVTIKRNYLNTALDGDVVDVQLLALKSKRKPKGEVINIISRDKKSIAGKLDYDGNFYFLVPDDKKHYVDFLIPEKKLNGAGEGDKVAVNLLRWDDPKKNPEAEVTEILGKQGDLSAEFASILTEFNLPEYFNDKVLKETENVEFPEDRPYDGRLDLRDKLIITIDPHDARDFDDALSLEILDNGDYYLGVHIADVSHYVKENSELDIEARLRGNSVYLVDRVVPMLPEILSNNVCSLRPDEPRFAYSVFMRYGKRGGIKDYKISESIIKSKRRYNYEEVQDIIESGIGDNSELILNLYKLTQILRKKRFKSGGIEFDTSEVKFILNENNVPVDVKLKTTTPSTALVEEAMLAANKTVAAHVENYKYFIKAPFLYRVHEKPDPEKIREAFKFISTFGKKIKAKNVTSRQINDILEYFSERPEKNLVHQVLIRSMQKAVYSNQNIGHYGLGFGHYSHFTSPIRRYPDLIVHRTLKEYESSKVNPDRLKYLNLFMKSIGNHCSQTERNAMEAERASIKLAHSIMAEKEVGKVFNGTVTGVTSFGLFIMLEDIYAEGLLHIKDLLDDYYMFDEKNFRLVGKRKKRIFSLGSKLQVKLINADHQKRIIDLAYIKQLND